MLGPARAITSPATATASRVSKARTASSNAATVSAVKAASSPAVATITESAGKKIARAHAMPDGRVSAALQLVVRDVSVRTVLRHAPVNTLLAAVDLTDSASVRMDGRDRPVILSALKERLERTAISHASA